MIPVNEMFETIQGEATHTGRPSVFIRLQGCPVGCPWCDTKYTWELDQGWVIDPGVMLTKNRLAADKSWAPMSEDLILELLDKYRARHVVLTGGEPAMENLIDLTSLVIASGRSIQIETSGTFPVQCDIGTWVTVSPKLAMPGNLAVRNDVLARADEIKFPVGKESDIRALHDLIGRGCIHPNTPIWLQPLSLNRRATDLCRDNAIANNWRVSVQVHALAGWR
jgi:7-carboxy-7-deazaguanine synthase